MHYFLWPVLFAIPVTIYWIGAESGYPIAGYNLAYFGLAGILWGLERIIPYELEWMKSDGQFWNDIGHTALTKGFTQLLATSAALLGVSMTSLPVSPYWPVDWPLFLQVFIALIVAEFGLYWAHRIAHLWWPAWCWHAVHHSVNKLWFINTGRFHVFDSTWKIIFAVSLGGLVGAPKDVVMWVLVITPFIGFLTHCNVDMRCGWLNWLVNTPELHRWHHSRNPDEGNRNFGENLMLWDIVFGTWFLPHHLRPPVDIGCPDQVPESFIGQLLYPIRAWINLARRS